MLMGASGIPAIHKGSDGSSLLNMPTAFQYVDNALPRPPGRCMTHVRKKVLDETDTFPVLYLIRALKGRNVLINVRH